MLTTLEKKIYKEIKIKFGSEVSLYLENNEYLRCKDVLKLLEKRGIIRTMSADNAHIFYKTGSFAVFEEWLSDIEKEERKLSRREWKIAIIGGGIGSLISLIPDIIKLITNLFK